MATLKDLKNYSIGKWLLQPQILHIVSVVVSAIDKSLCFVPLGNDTLVRARGF